MTQKEALQKVLDAAVELWAGDTRQHELRDAIEVIAKLPTAGRLRNLTDEDERA